MRVVFRNTEQTQIPLTLIQSQTRHAKRKHYPVLRYVGLILATGLICFGLYHYLQRNTVYTYGIVAGPTQEPSFATPMEILNMVVHRGDVVQKGDVLATLTPALSAQNDNSSDMQSHQIRMAQAEVTRQQAQLTVAHSRQDRVTHLFKAGAATVDNVTQAQHAVTLAQLDYEVAQEQLAFLTNQQQLASSSLFASSSINIEDHTVKALFNGIITSEPSQPGQTLLSGDSLLYLASTDTPWIDCYIPSDKVSRITNTHKASIYVETSSSPLQGTLSQNEGVYVKIPELLQRKLTHVDNGTYLRIHVTDTDHQLKPGKIVRVAIRPDTTLTD